MSAIPIDGRIARSERTRQAIIDAMLSLFAEENLTPTIEELASRVGMTSRTIYHHFEDSDAIADALTEHQRQQLAPLMIGPVTGTLAERIEGLVANRAEVFETIAPVRRAARANMHRWPRVRTGQGNIAARLRRQVSATFEPELAPLDRAARNETIELLDLHTSWDTWERLRRWQRVSVPRARALVSQLVAQTFDAHTADPTTANTPTLDNEHGAN